MAAIVNYRDLLLQGSTTRYIPPASSPIYVMPEDLGDLAYMDQVTTPQIAPGSITAGSAIVAPGAILTQALALNAVTIPVAAYTAASVASNTLSVGSPNAIQTLPNFTSKGGKVLLHGGFVFDVGGGAIASGVVARLRRNSSDVASFSLGTLGASGVGAIITLPPVTDEPGNGVGVVYTLTVEWSGATDIFYLSNRGLLALECIR
jgi:hypothetical protein